MKIPVYEMCEINTEYVLTGKSEDGDDLIRERLYIKPTPRMIAQFLHDHPVVAYCVVTEEYRIGGGDNE